MLPALHLEVLLQELTPLIGIPLQLAQQAIALGQQVAPPQRNRGVLGIGAGLQPLQALEVAQQIAVGGETAAAGMAKRPLQVDAFLLPLPAQPFELQVDLGQLAAPVFWIRFRLQRDFRPTRCGRGWFGQCGQLQAGLALIAERFGIRLGVSGHRWLGLGRLGACWRLDALGGLGLAFHPWRRGLRSGALRLAQASLEPR